MKKTYIIPAIRCVELKESFLNATSGVGVATGQLLGDEFNGDDVSYSKGLDNLDRGDISDNSLWSKDRW